MRLVGVNGSQLHDDLPLLSLAVTISECWMCTALLGCL